MEALLMQLAMAAMSQFGGGRSVPMSGGMPIPMPSRPMAPYSSPAPVSNGLQPSMQASTLASTTCLLRSGRISRDQGLGSVGADLSGDRTIDSAGGCRALLNGITPGSAWQGAPIQVAGGHQGRSQREGFGLYPYR